MRSRVAILMVLIGALGLGLPVRGLASTPADSSHNRRAALRGLPLIEVPAAAPGPTFAVLVSGDGGWALLEHDVAGALARAGVTVVGFNSLRYFWTRRSPDQASADLARVLRYYLSSTGARDVLLVGYSRGADVLPFMADRLPPELLGRVRLVALLGPSRSVDFKFHVLDWLKDARHPSDLPVLPEARKLVGVSRLLCVYGTDETDTICPELAAPGVRVLPLTGAHHFDDDYAALGQAILAAAAPGPAAP